MSEKQHSSWWQNGIIYQVYPRSFQDSNGDGVGDLKGILHRLGYLQWLGVNAIWMSPVFQSPMKDFGYDISDYLNIDPIFGDMADFDALITAIHQRGMKLIIDFVPNHTSDQHPWFIESRSSVDNPKRDWYIWQPAREEGSPPNNWLSMFGGSAWQWDEPTKAYYYHAFLKEQPDLNFRNPDVLNAMLDIMRFWLNKGVDGFRVDVIWHLIKDKLLRDNPANPDYTPQMADYDSLLPVYSTDQPEVHQVVSRMRQLLDQYDQRMMIGEIYLPVDKLVVYYGTAESRGAHLPFNFLLIQTPWNAKQIAALIDKYEGLLPADGWPNWVLGNHDQPRIASRIGLQQARVAAMLLLTLRGTPTIYYGDELGMADVVIPAGEIRDPQGLNMPDKNLSRDPARTPMPWSKNPNGGFTNGKPWLRLDTSHETINVDCEKQDPASMLALYKDLIALRQQEPALYAGNYIPVYSDQQLIAYQRENEDADSFLVVLNLTHQPARFKPPHPVTKGRVVLSTTGEATGREAESELNLPGDEGLIIRIKKHHDEDRSNISGE